jgi:hypothetical protein
VVKARIKSQPATRPLIPEGYTEPVLCPQCKAPVAWPAAATTTSLSEAAATWRSKGLPAVYIIQNSLGLPHFNAKVLTFHLTREKGCCHRCGKPVSEGVSICANCNSVNLDW